MADSAGWATAGLITQRPRSQIPTIQGMVKTSPPGQWGRSGLWNGYKRFRQVPALTLLLLACAVQPAHGQSYCARMAALVDAPANVRSLPTRNSAIVCQLRPVGLRFRIFPILPRSFARQHEWLATLACQGHSADARIGLGARRGYIHQSQLRLVGIDSKDWPPDKITTTQQSPQKTCKDLWQPYDVPSTAAP